MSWQTPLALCLWAAFVVLCLLIVGTALTIINRFVGADDEEGGRRLRRAVSETSLG
jgi:hypothetical protein